MLAATVALADDPNALLSKEDAAQMFAISEAQWVANVEAVKASQSGDYAIAPSGEYTLYLRPDPSVGLLAVSPSYSPNDKNRPWKLSVTVIADTSFLWLVLCWVYGRLREARTR